MPRRSSPQPSLARAATGIGLVGGSTGLGVVAGAPWWATLGCQGAALLVAALHLVFPQDSADRLEWWRLWWTRGAEPGNNPDSAP
ncbi:hypothetical protein [Kitasatospora sp. CB01950]|uniref:hypothetical protein n=1 Tax=Kitasatospora sp. CB01950 TaxID=1703930 RepID=UPI00093F2E2B|nr:hypothetical protein [Kitasatospora sp. CB01950]OKJ15608.1 hypothetical protein AMK19_04790 [Kitasatospora sp. CB01950]